LTLDYSQSSVSARFVSCKDSSDLCFDDPYNSERNIKKKDMFLGKVDLSEA
jgi:hypothetical protein